MNNKKRGTKQVYTRLCHQCFKQFTYKATEHNSSRKYCTQKCYYKVIAGKGAPGQFENRRVIFSTQVASFAALGGISILLLKGILYLLK